MSRSEIRRRVCPVCGWDESRDTARYSSLCRLGAESGLLSGGEIIAVPKGEWDALQRELAALREQLGQTGAPPQLPAPPADPDLWELALSVPLWSIRPKKDADLPEVVAVPDRWEGRTVERLESAAFQGRQLCQAILPGGLREIGSYAFNSCRNLRQVLLPDSVERLEKYSFGRCSSLEEIHFPAALRQIDSYAFFYCMELKEAALPEGLLELGESAFSGCVGLRRVTLPASLKKMGRAAFYGCSSLEEVVFKGPVETLEEGIFPFCKSLRRVTLPASWQEGREKVAEILPKEVQIEYQ